MVLKFTSDELYTVLFCFLLIDEFNIFTSLVYLDAAVSGDTNLELPTALSNVSFVEIHMDPVPLLKENHELVVELPLHVRYPVSSEN